MSKIALITGITGQDGYYLSQLLLKKKYVVHGIVRSNFKSKKKFNWRIKDIQKKLILHKLKIDDNKKLDNLLKKIKPDEIYHLAAQIYVDNFKKPKKRKSTMKINYLFTKSIVKSIRRNNIKSKLFFAGTSEMFGTNLKKKFNEKTKFKPESPYGKSKVASYKLIKNFRIKHNMHLSTGILFNHESPKKDKSFVLRKISSSVAKIKTGLQSKIFLGDINSKRDWGHAKDFVRAMWLICQQKKPDDYVIGTGKLHSVEDFIKLAFKQVKLEYRNYLIIDKKLIRKKDSKPKKADISKIKDKLKWRPIISFKKMAQEMVINDLKILNKR